MQILKPLSKLSALALALAASATPSAAADTFPSRPIRVVVPWAVGTPPDVAARVVAAKMQEILKQPVVVDNKPGASGTIGLGDVARQPADGYTLAALHSATASVVSLYPSFRTDLAKDMVPVGMMEWSHNVLVVSPSLGVKSIKELAGYLKKTSTGTFASSGIGTPAHLSGLMFLKSTGASAEHVPYNQFAQAVTDVASGRVDFMVLAAVAAVPQINGGKLTALAVTAPKRNPNIKDVPTVQEVGLPAMASRTWSGLVARAGTPPEALEKLRAAAALAVAQPEVREQLAKVQSEPESLSHEQFGALIRKEVETGTEFVKTNGIKLD